MRGDEPKKITSIPGLFGGFPRMCGDELFVVASDSHDVAVFPRAWG